MSWSVWWCLYPSSSKIEDNDYWSSILESLYHVFYNLWWSIFQHLFNQILWLSLKWIVVEIPQNVSLLLLEIGLNVESKWLFFFLIFVDIYHINRCWNCSCVLYYKFQNILMILNIPSDNCYDNVITALLSTLLFFFLFFLWFVNFHEHILQKGKQFPLILLLNPFNSIYISFIETI